MWFTETSWPPIAICLAAAAILLICWKRNARNLYLYGIVGLGVAAAAIFFVEQQIVTEVETVERLQLELAEAVKDDDVAKVLGFVSQPGTLVRGMIEKGMSQVEVEPDISFTDVSARKTDDGMKIISHIRANGRARWKSGGQGSGHVATRWEFTWERNGDNEWKVVKFVRLNVMSGEPIDLFDTTQ